ncbi:MAG: DUF2304 domain-containing protein [Parasporobacterium sp.]|nr:DUF2304 domain-containing protein [Parasporobacterium sp.]
MTLKIQLIIIIISLIAIISTIILIRKGKMGVRIAIPWLVVFAFIILFAAIPTLMDWLAEVVGIHTPVSMALMMGIMFMGLVIYSLTITVYDNVKKTRALIQKVAVLEKELKEKNAGEN